MRGVLAHAALLAVALVAALLTWTAVDRPQSEAELVQVWDRKPEDLVQVSFRAPDRSLVIDRRGDRRSAYYWASERIQPPSTPTAPGTPASAAQVEQYPLSALGDSLLGRLARLQAVRDLGKPDREELAAYGLNEPRSTLTLKFRSGGDRTLAIGGTVVGGGHRYVLDRGTSRAYVLPADLIQPLEFAGNLRLSQIYGFNPDEVRSVVLRAGNTERVMQRQPSAEGQPVWSDPATGRADQTFGNFMEQLGRLFVTRYRQDVSAENLQPILRAAYLNARRDTLGTLELYRTRTAPSAVYFVRTGATIVPGEAYPAVAERIEQDLQTVFRAGGR